MLTTQELLQTYMKVKNNPTFREITKDTGIQTTRVFRIFNGAELKLSESEQLKEAIARSKKVEENKLSALVTEGVTLLPAETLKRFEDQLSRYLELHRLSYGRPEVTTSFQNLPGIA